MFFTGGGWSEMERPSAHPSTSEDRLTSNSGLVLVAALAMTMGYVYKNTLSGIVNNRDAKAATPAVTQRDSVQWTGILNPQQKIDEQEVPFPDPPEGESYFAKELTLENLPWGNIARGTEIMVPIVVDGKEHLVGMTVDDKDRSILRLDGKPFVRKTMGMFVEIGDAEKIEDEDEDKTPLLVTVGKTRMGKGEEYSTSGELSAFVKRIVTEQDFICISGGLPTHIFPLTADIELPELVENE